MLSFGILVESPDLDVETVDMLAELTDALAVVGVELRLSSVRMHPHELLRRSGLADRVKIEPTLAIATGETVTPAG